MSDAQRARLKHVYDPKHFSDNAKKMAEHLSAHLQQEENATSALFRQIPHKNLIQEADMHLAGSDLHKLSDWFLQNSRLLHSPHYLGHQVSAPIPAASLFTWMSALTNAGGAVYEMGPSLAAIERSLVRRLISKIGWDETADGIVTNGGTLANLTALLTARNVHFKNAWKKGWKQVQGKTPIVLTSQDSHYSISRAVGIMGLGTEQVVKLPLNEKRQVTAQSLEETLSRCKSQNQEVFCVVASTCTTATGSFDQLEDIGNICKREKIWLHVDGAHGASVLFSKTHKHLAKGIQYADSVTWDAHKMLFVHSLCTFLLYKNGRDSFETFQQDAPYLFNGAEIAETSYLDGGLRTLECTRQAIALPLWGVWSLYGEQVFEDCLDICFENAKMLYQMVKEDPHFEPVHAPEANILCFRYKAKTVDQMLLKEKLHQSGKFYITSTVLDGTAALRVTLINPLIDRDHLKELLKTLSSYDLPTSAS